MLPPNQKPESHALRIRLNGLNYLYNSIRTREQERVAANPDSVRSGFCDFGSSDTGDIIHNHFLWYASSLIPFIDLFTKAYQPAQNLRKEFRSVLQFRRKVAAHHSHTDPQTDPLLTQQASINLFISWASGRYSIGREIFGNPETGEFTPSDWGWELTEVHERLISIISPYFQ